ncbi:hypothetical protein LRC484719_48330 [Mycobacterium riyadhense]
MTGPITDADAPPQRRVLIAEGEALIRMDLAEMLREEGYEIVGEAGDGQEAVELAERHLPDLVIMDVKMPRRDGIDAASEIASKRIAPIVVLTAFSQRDLVERARDAGAMAYLVKPFTISDLIPAIEFGAETVRRDRRAGTRSGDPVRSAGNPQARRTCQRPAADQTGHERARGVQVDSAYLPSVRLPILFEPKDTRRRPNASARSARHPISATGDLTTGRGTISR